MNLKTLQKILGHATFATTMNVYADVMPNTMVSEMQKVAGGLL